MFRKNFKKRNCQKDLIVCALPVTEYDSNLCQVELFSLYHLKTSDILHF